MATTVGEANLDLLVVSEAEAHMTPFAVYRALRHVNPSRLPVSLGRLGLLTMCAAKRSVPPETEAAEPGQKKAPARRGTGASGTGTRRAAAKASIEAFRFSPCSDVSRIISNFRFVDTVNYDFVSNAENMRHSFAQIRCERRSPMLRFLRLQNWKSYYEPVEFTMVATRERRHGDRLARVGRSRVLPITAVYGANAAGKSTLVDGLEALSGIVLESRRAGAMLPVAPHLPEGRDEPTVFAVEIVVSAVGAGDDAADRVFYYELAADRRRVHRELLAQVKARTEELLFERDEDGVALYGELDGDERARAHAMVVVNRTYVILFLYISLYAFP